MLKIKINVKILIIKWLIFYKTGNIINEFVKPN